MSAPRRPAPAGVVFCGGASARMGRDKALMGEPPWAHRVGSALAAAGCRPVTLLGGDPRLGDGPFPHVADAARGAGPGPALVQAAGLQPGHPLVVAACDLPMLTAADVRPLLSAAGRDGSAAYVLDDRPQWSLVALGEEMVDRLAAAPPGNGSLRELLWPGTVLVTPAAPERVDDLDTPVAAAAAAPDGRRESAVRRSGR